MSLLQELTRGSLLSDERLLSTRDGYAPIPADERPAAAFAHWTQRVAVQH